MDHKGEGLRRHLEEPMCRLPALTSSHKGSQHTLPPAAEMQQQHVPREAH